MYKHKKKKMYKKPYKKTSKKCPKLGTYGTIDYFKVTANVSVVLAVDTNIQPWVFFTDASQPTYAATGQNSYVYLPFQRLLNVGYLNTIEGFSNNAPSSELISGMMTTHEMMNLKAIKMTYYPSGTQTSVQTTTQNIPTVVYFNVMQYGHPLDVTLTDCTNLSVMYLNRANTRRTHMAMEFNSGSTIPIKRYIKFNKGGVASNVIPFTTTSDNFPIGTTINQMNTILYPGHWGPTYGIDTRGNADPSGFFGGTLGWACPLYHGGGIWVNQVQSSQQAGFTSPISTTHTILGTLKLTFYVAFSGNWSFGGPHEFAVKKNDDEMQDSDMVSVRFKKTDIYDDKPKLNMKTNMIIKK